MAVAVQCSAEQVSRSGVSCSPLERFVLKKGEGIPGILWDTVFWEKESRGGLDGFGKCEGARLTLPTQKRARKYDKAGSRNHRVFECGKAPTDCLVVLDGGRYHETFSDSNVPVSGPRYPKKRRSDFSTLYRSQSSIL